MDIRKDVEIKSWDGIWTYRPAVIVTPKSAEDIVAIMRDPDRFPSPVRPAGSMHSTARVNGDAGGTMVDMKAMKRVIEITDRYATVEAGLSYLDLSNALKSRGLQHWITTEIGNTTLGAMATAATKDSSFPDEWGQVSSYVTGVKLVAPDGEIRSFNETDDPDEMRLIRSSYGLFGIVFEVTIRVRRTYAIAVRHEGMTLPEFAARFPRMRAEGDAVMYYLFPYAGKVIVERRHQRHDVEPKARRMWQYRNRFWRKYGPAIGVSVKRWTQNPNIVRLADDAHFAILRRALVTFVRGQNTIPHAQTINYPRNPGANRYLFSMWSFPERRYFETLKAYFAFCQEHYHKTGFRCDLPHVGYAIARDRQAILSYSWEGYTLSIDPASTGGEGWAEFLRAYNEFCVAHGGQPLLNQTPHLTREQVARAFGDRLDILAAARRERDPSNRMLDSYFAELLGEE
jgi:L-gulonolactone oxidase